LQKKIFCFIFLILIFSTLPFSFAQQNNNFESEFNFDNKIFFLIFNFTLLFLILLIIKNKIPNNLKKIIQNIFSFDLSKKNTQIILCVIFSLYIISVINELDDVENLFGDSIAVTKHAENFTNLYIENFDLDHLFTVIPSPNYVLLSTSIQLFDNIKIIPFIGSLFLIFVTYILTKEITKKRFAGIISILVILQSPLFLKYDTIATYTNFWMLFYLISLYLIIKRWQFSVLSYLISLFTKPLTILFLPISISFIYNALITKKEKYFSYFAYLVIIIVGVIVYSSGSYVPTIEQFNYNEFLSGLKQFSSFMKDDLFIIVAILPLTVGLFIISRRGNQYANSIQVMIGVIFLSFPLIIALTPQNNHDYRMIPIVIAFALGIGTLFSNTSIEQIKKSKKVISILVFIFTFSIVGINIISVIFPGIIQGTYQVQLG